ncbi:MAG: hypothetical protein JRM80_08930 [Nitrososphaerota archaeon]|nr:hypothetical protein [Nitrososphaerota archaeon]MDG6989964.1 hypothetical protein [Nitrososphaerota archaeon]
MVKKVAIIRWTGRGSAMGLRSSVEHVLKERKAKAAIQAVGKSLLLSGPEPIGACLLFENMPGVAWAAAGYSASGGSGVAEAASLLAANYLRRGTRFSVLAEVSGPGASSDLAGSVTSAMLEEVKGARATNEAAKVRFRAALDDGKGAVGVEVLRGPGGSPMGEAEVVCLVSGGVHSSVLAWNALLQGFRVKLVHASSGEEGLFAAAKLYAELSNRGDPRGVSLTVLDGGPVAALLSEFLSSCKGPVFGGFTVGRPAPPGIRRRVESPLFLLPEEAFESQFKSLELRGTGGTTAWGARSGGTYSTRSYGGKIADVSGVIDGLA